MTQDSPCTVLNEGVVELLQGALTISCIQVVDVSVA